MPMLASFFETRMTFSDQRFTIKQKFPTILVASFFTVYSTKTKVDFVHSRKKEWSFKRPYTSNQYRRRENNVLIFKNVIVKKFIVLQWVPYILDAYIIEIHLKCMRTEVPAMFLVSFTVYNEYVPTMLYACSYIQSRMCLQSVLQLVRRIFCFRLFH